jgi:UDP-2-acetamido-3-amino-2,3-dideoxy-glucuronate N-acetyltransferase
MTDLGILFPDVKFYNPNLTEVQENVSIGRGTRVGSFTLIQSGARIGIDTTVGSHCNICDCRIGDRVSIQTFCHITRGVVIEDDVFIGPGLITLNDKLNGEDLLFPRVCRGARIGGACVILPGVVIGEGALVGAGSVVVRDVAPGEIVIGNPVRRVLSAGHRSRAIE